jgi:hypothetical protein
MVDHQAAIVHNAPYHVRMAANVILGHEECGRCFVSLERIQYLDDVVIVGAIVEGEVKRIAV